MAEGPQNVESSKKVASMMRGDVIVMNHDGKVSE
jgi:hypothetical protein